MSHVGTKGSVENRQKVVMFIQDDEKGVLKDLRR